MENILGITQLIFAVSLTVFILLQAKGTGLSQVFGGGGNIYRTKRGIEKMLFRGTILFAVLFIINSLLLVISDRFSGLFGL